MPLSVCKHLPFTVNLSFYRFTLRISFLLLAVPLCIPLFAISESDSTRVFGYVENLDGTPLQYATIKLLTTSDSSLVKGGAADANGYFQFNNLAFGSYILSFTSVNAIPIFSRHFIIDSLRMVVDVGKIKVNQKVTTINEVIITGEKPLLESKGDRLIVNVNNSFLAAGNSLDEILNVVPGVSTTNSGTVLNGKPVLILIDGKGQYNTNVVNETIRNIGANMVESIEVISNPSAKYDANIQGIINIKLKKEKSFSIARFTYQQQLYPTTDVSGADFRRIVPGMSLNYRLNNIGITASFDYVSRSSFEQNKESIQHVQRIERVTKHTERENFFIYQTDVQYKIKNNPDHFFGVSLSGSYNIVNRGFFDAESQFHGLETTLLDSSMSSFTKSKSTGIMQNNVTAYYSNKFNDGLDEIDLIFDFYSRKGTSNSDFLNVVSYPDQSASSTEDIGSKQISEIDGNSLNVNYVNRHLHSVVWESGVKYTRLNSGRILSYETTGTEITGGSLYDSHFDYHESLYAAYTSLNKTFGSYEISGGLRLEQVIGSGGVLGSDAKVKRQYLKLYPNLSVDYKINEDWTLRTSIARKISRRPSLSDLNPTVEYRNSLNLFVGNSDIMPQMSTQFYFSTVYKSKYMFSFYYDQDRSIRDVIPLLTDDQYITFQTVNLEKGSSMGVNLSVAIKVNKLWEVKWNIDGSHDQIESKKYSISTSSLNYTSYINNVINVSSKINVQINFRYSSGYTRGFYEQEPIFYGSVSTNFSVLRDRGVFSFNAGDIFGSNILKSQNTYFGFYTKQLSGVSNQRGFSFKLTYRFITGDKFSNSRKQSKNFDEIRYN